MAFLMELTSENTNKNVFLSMTYSDHEPISFHSVQRALVGPS